MTGFEILAYRMDARDRYFKVLEEFFNIHGFVPEEHKIQWELYKARKEKPWRQDKLIVKRIKKAAKKIETVDDKIKHIAKTYNKTEEDVRKLYQYLQDWKLVLRAVNEK